MIHRDQIWGSLRCHRLIGSITLHKAQKKSFARPGTSANCVIARLPPQLSHLAEMGYKASRWRRPIYTPGRVRRRLPHLQDAAFGNSVFFCEAYFRIQSTNLLYQVNTSARATPETSPPHHEDVITAF
jgi:hypothetical protein